MKGQIDMLLEKCPKECPKRCPKRCPKGSPKGSVWPTGNYPAPYKDQWPNNNSGNVPKDVSIW